MSGRAEGDPWKPVKSLACGAGSGCITKTVTAPLERARILLQIQGMKGLVGADRKYIGTVGTLRTIVQEEGFIKLWRGNGTNVVRTIPVYACKFTFNDMFKEMLLRPGQDVRHMSFGQLILAGSLSGLFQQCVTYPLETVRSRITIGATIGTEYNGMLDVAAQLYKKEGAFAFYKGLSASILYGAPYVALQMSLFDALQQQFPKDKETGKVPITTKLLCGAVAGTTAQTCVFPFDTIRRRLQINGEGGAVKKYTNPLNCFTAVLRSEGVGGFYRGVTTNAIRMIPSGAIQFAAVDFLKARAGLETQ